MREAADVRSRLRAVKKSRFSSSRRWHLLLSLLASRRPDQRRGLEILLRRQALSSAFCRYCSLLRLPKYLSSALLTRRRPLETQAAQDSKEERAKKKQIDASPPLLSKASELAVGRGISEGAMDLFVTARSPRHVSAARLTWRAKGKKCLRVPARSKCWRGMLETVCVVAT